MANAVEGTVGMLSGVRIETVSEKKALRKFAKAGNELDSVKVLKRVDLEDIDKAIDGRRLSFQAAGVAVGAMSTGIVASLAVSMRVIVMVAAHHEYDTRLIGEQAIALQVIQFVDVKNAAEHWRILRRYPGLCD